MRFNVVHSALMGFKTVWEERAYLLKLALVPLLVKFACTMAVFTLDIPLMSFQHVLIMVPSYFVEGWFLAQFLRTILTGERWPMKLPNPPQEKDIAFMLTRARGLLACLLAFTLIMMLHSGAAIILNDIKEAMPTDPQDMPSGSSLLMLALAVALIFGTLWMFRIIWLYIPLVILAPVTSFLKDIKGVMTSIHLIALWVLSMVPVMFLSMLTSSLLLGVGGGEGTLQSAPSVAGFIAIAFHVTGEILSHLIATTAIAYAFKDILIKYGAKPIFIEPQKPY